MDKNKKAQNVACPDLKYILMAKIKFEKNYQKSDTLILGSSHMFFGWCGGGVNLTISSQDLYNSYQLYRFANNKMKNLKNIVISFSVFSPGFDLQKTKLGGDCVAYKQIFGIDYQSLKVSTEKGFLNLEREIDKEVRRKLRAKWLLNAITKNPYPKKNVKKNFQTEDVKKRTEGHLKNNVRKPDQMQYFLKLLDETYQNKQKVFVVVTPVMKIFRDCLPPKEQLFKKATETCAKFPHVEFLDFYDCEEFLPNMFLDPDHVNKQGAILLTEKILRHFDTVSI